MIPSRGRGKLAVHFGDFTPGRSVSADRLTPAAIEILKSKAVGALRRLQKRPGLVRAFFADPHLRYITT